MNLTSRFSFNNIMAKTTKFRSISCWSCGLDAPTLVSNLFCPGCKSLQKPDKKSNFFQVMGVGEKFEVDPTDLAKRYKDLQKYLHPDKYANREGEEKEISATYSSLVNEAYKTLLDPLSRGIYMLKLRGLDIPEQTEADKEFLMKIMEINEEVEEAETEADIIKLNKKNKAMIDDLQKQVSAAFFDGDMKRVIRVLSHLKYYTSIENQIQGVIRSKGIIR